MLAQELSVVILDQFVVPVIERWRDGAFRTGHDVRREIESLYDGWIRSDEGSAFFVQTINLWWRDEVKYALDKELDRLHTLYDISRDIQLQFDRAIEPELFSFSAKDIGLPFETIISAAIVTLAYAVTISIDAVMGGIPFVTGALTAAVAVGGRFTRSWISSVDVPGFARKLPGQLPGRDRLFGGQVRSRVQKQLSLSFDTARDTLARQVELAVSTSIESQIRRAKTLLMGSEAQPQ